MKIGSDLSDNIEYLKFLEREKKFSDSIVNHSKSMISIINRNYIYEKVNVAFCNAHQQVMDSIVGNHLLTSGEQKISGIISKVMLTTAFLVKWSGTRLLSVHPNQETDTMRLFSGLFLS